MKKRRLLLILLGCVACSTLMFLLWPREREPEYNGIPLSAWLERAGGVSEAEFTTAIKLMGTNALPGLVRAVDYQSPRWRFWLGFKILRLPRTIATSRLAQWVLEDRAERRADSAVVAFGILGRDALPALDDLRQVASKHPGGSATWAIFTLMSRFPGDFDESRVRL